MIKLIVMDMDGTLLTSDKKVSMLTKQKLMEAQNKGVRLALASGRSMNRLMDHAQELKLDEHNGYLIEGNGVGYYEFEHAQHTLLKRCSREDIQEMIDFLKPLQVEILVMGERDAYIMLPEGRKTSYWLEKVHVENVNNRDINYIQSLDEVDQALNKVCVCESPETVDRVSKALVDINPRFWHGRIMPHWIEITLKEIHKGNALSKIMEKHNLKKEEVLVFGDGENDISMLEVGTGIAMGNALDSVKHVCYDVCASNNEDGIGKQLIKMKV